MQWLIFSCEQTALVKQCDNVLRTAGQIVYHDEHHGKRSYEEIREKILQHQPDRIIVICNENVNENHSPLNQTLNDQLLIPFYVCQVTMNSYLKIPTLLLTFTNKLSSTPVIQDAANQLLDSYPLVLNAKLITPISNDDFNKQDLLTKFQSLWQIDPDQAHHITILSDILPILIALIHDGKTSGKIDVCNKGTISLNWLEQVLSEDTDDDNKISSTQDIETLTDQLEQWNYHRITPSVRHLYQASFVLPHAKKSLKEYLQQKSFDEHPTSSRSILVTGGCGFVGSTFINHWLETYPNDRIINIDRLDPVANPKNISNPYSSNYRFILADINNKDILLHLMRQYHITHVVHFAVQAQLDASFGNSITFTESNVYGTHSVLEASRIYGHIEKFLHLSTDEVYGETPVGSSQETNLLNPLNPYAATIAAAEFLVKSYGTSFKLPYCIIRLNNIYGPRQHSEKVIPRFIHNCFQNEILHIHGDGKQIRHYIYVDDVIRAIEIVFHRGKSTMIYNVGTEQEVNILDIAKKICEKIQPKKNLEEIIRYAPKRSFREKRYATSSAAVKALGWKDEISFDQGLENTIQWYQANRD